MRNISNCHSMWHRLMRPVLNFAICISCKIHTDNQSNSKRHRLQKKSNTQIYCLKSKSKVKINSNERKKVHFTLSTPTTIQFRSVFAFFKFTAIVKAKAFNALCYTQHWMHTNDFFGRRCRTDMCITACAMQTAFGHRINIGVCLNKILLFLWCVLFFEKEFKTYLKCARRKWEEKNQYKSI